MKFGQEPREHRPAGGYLRAMRRIALVIAIAGLTAAAAAPPASAQERPPYCQGAECIVEIAGRVADRAQELTDQVALAEPDSWVVDCAVGTAGALVRALEGTPQPHAC
jgi:hypothetical protein